MYTHKKEVGAQRAPELLVMRYFLVTDGGTDKAILGVGYKSVELGDQLMFIVEVVMSARDFQGTTYYYLRALSLTDLGYLLFVIGYYSEVLRSVAGSPLGLLDFILHTLWCSGPGPLTQGKGSRIPVIEKFC